MNRKTNWIALPATVVSMFMAPALHAQKRPFIGYVYPAGGQQGTTFQIKLGGQDLDYVNTVLVTGPGVTARVVEYYRRLGNQEVQLLNEQLKELKKKPAADPAMAPSMAAENPAMMSEMSAEKKPESNNQDPAQNLASIIEQRTREAVQTPACASIASIVLVEVTLAADAPPGGRELRLATSRGVSNPLPFHVGQVPESCRKPMISANLQVLGKEASALRKRPPEEAERSITPPCTVNGQIASGEVNRYRFPAKKGQRLMISTQARQLIPYVADAVPGWFQPVLALYDANGKELAYTDDYQFKPDPVILFEVPKDGEYVCAIRDGIYRGREDFVYRITIGEMPFITSIFPLGGPAGAPQPPNMTGPGLSGAKLEAPPTKAGPGVVELAANKAGVISNRVPFALDTLPDALEKEPNNNTAASQQVALPVIVNGRIDKPDDWDVFKFTGRTNDPVVIEVRARRLDSPLDSVIKLTDATGKVLAFNDDCEDLTAGTNTHHADSYLMTQLPADGTYFVHIGDTARHSGGQYAYRLRISAPRPDFELRVVPSSVSLAIKTGATVSVYAVRKDGFTGPIKLTLKNPPQEFTAGPVTIPADQPLAKFYFKGSATPTTAPVELSIAGSAMLGTQETVRDAVPAEDRMQAFLWRHLVPASDLKVLVFDPKILPKPKHVAPFRAPPIVGPPYPAVVTTPDANALKPKITAQQIGGRLRQLKMLFEEGLLTDKFYDVKITECEVDL